MSERKITGILGTKLGMTQVFDENNRVVPVTVVQAGPNVVTQIRTPEADGYVAASPCESDPKYGAMGFHYANEEHLSDGVLDPLRPEIAVKALRRTKHLSGKTVRDHHVVPDGQAVHRESS